MTPVPQPHPEDDDMLRRYLLGETSDEEQTLLEQGYLADEDLFARLRAVESELIEDYWRDRLASAARQRFEAHYLSSPVRRERAAFVKSLIDYASRSGAADMRPHSVAEAAPGRAAPAAWARAAVWAILIVGGSLLAAWLLRSALRSRPLADPSRRQNQEARSTTSPGPSAPAEGRGAVRPRLDLAAWQLLIPGRARSIGQGTATVTAVPGPIRLQLDLPRSGPGTYTVVLQNADGREMWRTTAIDAERGTRDWAVFVEIDLWRPASPGPRAALPDGDYVLSLKAVNGDPNAAAEYFFRVAPR